MGRVSSDLIFLYFSKTMREKSWIFNFKWKFHINNKEAIHVQDINADTSIVVIRSCIATDTFMRPSSVVRPSVNFSHFNQILWSHWANLNQTLVEWSLDGPLPKLCPVIPTSNQDGRQAIKKKKKGGDEILIVHCCFSVSQNKLKF